MNHMPRSPDITPHDSIENLEQQKTTLALNILKSNKFVPDAVFQKFKMATKQTTPHEVCHSHVEDILELQEMLNRICDLDIHNLSSLGLTQKDYALFLEIRANKEYINAGFIYQDIGKAKSLIVARLYNLLRVTPTETIGDVVRKHIPNETSDEDYEDLWDYIHYALAQKISHYAKEGQEHTVLSHALDRITEEMTKQNVPVQKQTQITADLLHAIETNTALKTIPPQELLSYIPMRFLYDAHLYHSAAIMRENKEAIMHTSGISDEEFTKIYNSAVGHHYIEGNTLLLPQDISTTTIVGELIDKVEAGFGRWRKAGTPPNTAWEENWYFIKSNKIARITDPDIRAKYERVADVLMVLYKPIFFKKNAP